MRSINPTFTEDEFQALKEAKQDRTWREAVLNEFGVEVEIQ